MSDEKGGVEKKDDKRSFVMYVDFPEATKKLSDSQFRELVLAMCQYTQHETLPELSQAADIAFSVFKVTLDRDREKWESTKEERSKAGKAGAAARWGNGK